MDRKIHFGIIGFGKIGPRHKNKIDENQNCHLTAVCDIDASKLQALKNTNIKIYQDYKKLLDNEKVDVVSICTPNYLHAPMTIDALNAGKHVLCEKPMTIRTKDCQRMIDASLRNDKKLFVVMQNRYNPPVQAVRELLNEGKMGRIYYIVLNCYWNRNKDYYADSPWKGDKDKDGGALFTQFSHFIDLMYWFGGDVKSVYATAINFNHPEINTEDSGAVIVRFTSGTLGTVNYTNCAHGKNMEGSITIFAENGTVKIGGEYLNTLDYQNVQNCRITGVFADRGANDYGTYRGSMSNHHIVYENVVDVLLNNARIDVDGVQGLQNVRIIESAYESIATGREVFLAEKSN